MRSARTSHSKTGQTVHHKRASTARRAGRSADKNEDADHIKQIEQHRRRQPDFAEHVADLRGEKPLPTTPRTGNQWGPGRPGSPDRAPNTASRQTFLPRFIARLLKYVTTRIWLQGYPPIGPGRQSCTGAVKTVGAVDCVDPSRPTGVDRLMASQISRSLHRLVSRRSAPFRPPRPPRRRQNRRAGDLPLRAR